MDLVVPQDLINSIREKHLEGLYYLRNGRYSEAEEIFSQELKKYLERQAREKEKRIHKGAPLHNLGLSLIFGNRPYEGLKFILLAYVEDIVTGNKKGAADNLPACIALRSLCAVPPKFLRDLEYVVLTKMQEGLLFLDPEENYLILSAAIKAIESNFKAVEQIYKYEIEGQKFLSVGEFGRAEQVYAEWYQTLIQYQDNIELRVHKGHPLHNIGISLYSQRKFSEAIRFFILAYVEDTAFEYQKGDADNLPAFKTLKDGFGLKLTFLRSIEGLVHEKKAKEEFVDPEKVLSEIETRVTQEQAKLTGSLKEIIKSKEENVKKLLSRFTKKKAPDNLFVVLRRWNSATPRFPTLPKHEENKGSVGGGYYLRWQNKGFVIDPGYDFLPLFFQEQFGMNHIDAILATHAHDDHTQDVETIFSLLYKMNKKLDQKKKIKLFCSEGVKIKYSRLIDVTQTEATDLTPGDNIELPSYNLRINSTKTDHNEEPWMKNNTGVGLIIELRTPDNGLFRMGITGDTKYWKGMETAFKDLDLLVAHLGTIGDPKSQHLQEEGCVMLIKATHPKLTVISEFGEELIDQRCKICDRIKAFVGPLKEPDGISILPGDVGLKIKLPNLKIYCENSKKYEEYKKVVATELDGQIHYLDKSKLT